MVLSFDNYDRKEGVTLERKVNFQVEEALPAWLEDYPEDKFTVFNACFLSTAKNSHKYDISKEVLKRDASTILGNFLVAKVQYGDAQSHEPDEIIYGYFPKEQEIRFEEVNGVVKAWAYCVVSKLYSKDLNNIFDIQNLRDTSVEMTVTTSEEDEHEVLALNIYGLTCLGLSVNGSCPDAMMSMVRFSEEEAKKYFTHLSENSDGKEETAMPEETKELEKFEEETVENTEGTTENEEKMAELEEQEAKDNSDDEEGSNKEEETEEKSEEVSEESADMAEECKCAEMSLDEAMSKCAELQSAIEEKENIIMEKDQKLAEQEAELAELREFKCGVEKEKLTKCVEATMAEVKDFVDTTKFAELRDEGLACKSDELDAWTNKVKATCFSAIQKKGIKKQTSTIWTFSAPNDVDEEPTDFWGKMNNKYN